MKQVPFLFVFLAIYCTLSSYAEETPNPGVCSAKQTLIRGASELYCIYEITGVTQVPGRPGTMLRCPTKRDPNAVFECDSCTGRPIRYGSPKCSGPGDNYLLPLRDAQAACPDPMNKKILFTISENDLKPFLGGGQCVVGTSAMYNELCKEACKNKREFTFVPNPQVMGDCCKEIKK